MFRGLNGTGGLAGHAANLIPVKENGYGGGQRVRHAFPWFSGVLSTLRRAVSRVDRSIDLETYPVMMRRVAAHQLALSLTSAAHHSLHQSIGTRLLSDIVSIVTCFVVYDIAE